MFNNKIRGPGFGPLNGNGGRQAPELPLKKVPLQAPFNYTPDRSKDIFDAQHIIEAVRAQYGDRLPELNIYGKEFCWHCGRVKKWGGMLGTGDDKHYISFAVCRGCIRISRAQYHFPDLHRLFMERCEQNLMKAYPYLGMEVPA